MISRHSVWLVPLIVFSMSGCADTSPQSKMIEDQKKLIDKMTEQSSGKLEEQYEAGIITKEERDARIDTLKFQKKILILQEMAQKGMIPPRELSRQMQLLTMEQQSKQNKKDTPRENKNDVI